MSASDSPARPASGGGRRPPIIAIDGPSGSGKSTAGKRVAQRLRFRYVDTGAMYRAVALRVLAEPDPEAALSRAGELARTARIETGWEAETAAFSIRLDGRDVTSAVREAAVASWASRVAAIPEVRAALVAAQRRLGEGGGVVMEGRDIGTVVFPEAEHKFFLEAPPAVRGLRRQAEEGRDAATVERELRERDRSDSTRALAPLRRAEDAVVVDVSALDVEGVVEAMLRAVSRHS